MNKILKYISFAVLGASGLFGSTVLAGQSVGNIDDSYQVERVTISLDGKLYAWDGKGNQISGWPIDLSEQHKTFILEPRLMDLDGDSRTEILAVSVGEDSSIRLHVYNGLAQEISKWSKNINTGGTSLTATPIISDINSDNSPETVFSTSDSKVHVLGTNGAELNGFPRQMGSSASLASADLKNGGRQELFGVAGDTIYIWELNEGTGLLEPNIFFVADDDNEAIGEMMAYDIDGDSFREIIFSTTKNRIYVVDRAGNAKKTIPVAGDVPILSQVSVGDVNLDGRPDIIALLADGTRVAYDANGSPLNDWLRQMEYRQFHEPSVGKIVDDLYNGAFSSATGWDLFTIYMSSLKNFAVFSFGQNVHEYDRRTQFYFAQAVGITDVSVRPLVFTPSGDGINDFAELNFTLSENASVDIDLYDSNYNFISKLANGETVSEGHHIKAWDGIDRKGTRTANDDRSVDAGVYILRIKAASKEGLISTAEAQAVVFGIKAKIEFPEDTDKTDDTYPAVWGTIGIRGVAADPNIGEGASGFDYNSFKLYYRPGVWTLSDNDVASAGQAGSSWVPIPVPLRLQSPTNLRNEPNDENYPDSNVGVSPVQHGILGSWDTKNIVNGEYTVLLKVIDGDLSGEHRFSYDFVHVNVLNQASGSGSGGGGGGGSGGGSGGGGSDGSGNNNAIVPRLENVNPLTSVISERARQANISYTLTGKPADVNITISRAGGNVVFTQTFLNRASERTYVFNWASLDNLGRQQPNGVYNVLITAAAIDGYGVDSNNSASVNVDIDDSYAGELNIVHFASSTSEFNPLDTDADLTQRSAAIVYALNKPARSTLEIYDEAGALRSRLLTNHLAQANGGDPVVWDGTDLGGLILPFGNYTCRLTAFGTEVGNDESVTAEIHIALSSLRQNEGITASIGKLIGDGKSGAVNDRERGILAHNDDPDDDFPLEGNPDFYWHATGSGIVVPDMEYDIRGWGSERYWYPSLESHEVVRELDGGLHRVGDSLREIFAVTDTIVEPDIFNDFSFTLLEAVSQYQIDIRVYRSNGSLYASYTSSDRSPTISLGQSLGFSGCPDCNRIDYRFARREPVVERVCEACPYKCAGGIEYCCPCHDVEEPRDDTAVRVVGRFTMTRNITSYGTRSWGTGDTGWISVGSLASGANSIGSYPSGSIGTGAGDVVGITEQNFSYSIREKLNNDYRTADFDTCGGGYKNIPFISAWMGSGGGADTGNCVSHSPNIFASLPQTSFSTAEDTTLRSGKISDLFSNFNEMDYKVLSDEINIYDAYAAKTSHPDLYTFSNAVRILNWNIDLKYPNGDPVEAFDVIEKEVYGTSSLDQDGNGIPEVNNNIYDNFRLKLKPDKAPRRFVEIRGNVDSTNYELKFYDAKQLLWQDIPVSLSLPHDDGTRTLGFWDVTQLNGRNYTVLLRVENNSGEINEDTINVGIGKEVIAGERATVRDAFGRTKLYFDDETLRNDSLPELVSATPVPNNDPLLPPLTLPTGTVPVGPVYNLQPDGIDIDPAHPVQMEITYTCEEVWNAFGDNPAEISVYNLKENGQLELISTLNPPADTCADSNPNEFFTITAMLEHFSDYIMLKDARDIPTFLITSPRADSIYKNPIHIEGNVSGADLESIRISYFADDDIFGGRTSFYEGAENTFNFDWESNLPSGEYTMVFEALNAAGLYNSISVPVHLDVEPPLTKIMLDGVVIPDGQSAFSTESGLISFAADDYAVSPSSAASLIEYKIDNGPYLQYVAPFLLTGMNVGKHEFTYISRDNAGNQEPERKAVIIIRGEVIPSGAAEIETQLVVNGASYESDGVIWVSSSSSFAIGAVRMGDELAAVSYRISGGEFVRYTEPIALTGSGGGIYLIEYFGTDIYGRDERHRVLKYAVDGSVPLSMIGLNGRYQQKDASSYLVNADTHISLSAEDSGEFMSGVKKIEYRVGGGVWQNYSEPFTVAGMPLLMVRAVDNVDNAEPVQEIHLQFDDEKPLVTMISADAAFSPNGDSIRDTMGMFFTASDGFSQALFYSLKVGDYIVRERVPIVSGGQAISWDGKSDDTVLPEGSYSYELYVEDEAGNRSDSVTGGVTLDITPPDLSFIDDSGQVAGAGGFTVGYRLDDNLARGNLKIEGSIVVGESDDLVTINGIVSVPPNENVLIWNGRNSSDNALPDGGYNLKLSAYDPSGNRSQIMEKHLSFDGTKPATLLKLDGKAKDGWISSSTRVVLEGVDHGSGISSTYYKFAGEPAITSYIFPFGITASGAREVHYWSVDNAGNQEEERIQILNVDALPPNSSMAWQGINRQIDGKDHISGASTELILEASDEHSGVSSLMFQIDASGPIIYSQPLSFHDFGDGPHVLKYWSVDEVGNKEAEKSANFILHGHPPDIQINFGAPKYQSEQLFVTSHTPVTVNVSSDAPDITSVQYKIDPEPFVAFSPDSVRIFETPEFTIPREGVGRIEAGASDDYENKREIIHSVIVDNTPPVTTIDQNQRAEGEINLVTPTTVFYLSRQDNLAGIQTTGYFIDSGDWKEYSGPLDLKGFSDGAHSIYYRSKDNLNNEEQTHKQDVELISVNAELTESDAPRVLVYYLNDDVADRGLSGEILSNESLSTTERALVELFESEPWHYKITSDGRSFIEELRSGIYDSILIVTDKDEYVVEASDLNTKIFREMTERIHGGMTLINFGSRDNIKGIPWQEMWRQFPLSSNDIASTYFESRIHAFGKGLVAQFDSNPAEFMDKAGPQDMNALKEELLDILSSVKPESAVPSPTEVIGLDAVLVAKESPVNIGLKAILPQGTVLIDALASDSKAEWVVDLEPGESKRLRYLVRLPSNTSDIDFEADTLTTWDNGLTYDLKINKSQNVGPTWNELWQSAVQILNGIADDASLPSGAHELVVSYRDKFDEIGNEGTENIESRIDLILDTIWNFSTLNGADGIEELRFALDDVLKVISIQTVMDGSSSVFSESAVDTDGDGISDDIEIASGLDPYDCDSDDDGVIDGREKGALVDSDGDGLINALDPDSDGDEIPDGLEMGVTVLPADPDGYGPIKSTDENAEIAFDSDSDTITDMTKADTDGGGLPDGVEDLNRNGRVDLGETDPNNPADDTNPTNIAGGGSGCNLAGSDNGNVFISILILSIMLSLLIGMRARRRCHRFAGNKLVVGVFAFYLLLSSGQSLAGDTSLNGFNVLSLHNPSDSSRLLFLYETQTLGHLKPAINFSLQGFGRTIETTNPVNSARNDLLGNVISGDLSVALGLGDNVDVGAILPVVLYNDALNVNTQSRSHFTGLGDLLLDAKWRIFKNKEKSVGLGILSRFSAPTGDPRQFTGWEKPTEEIRLVLDKSLSSFYINLNAGYRIAAKTTVTNAVSGASWNITNGNSLTFGLGIQYALPIQNRTWGIEISAEGETSTGDFKELTTPVNVMGGISKKFSNGMSLKLGGGRGVTNAVGSPLWRAFASVGVDLGYKERVAKEQNVASPQIRYISKTIRFAFNKWNISRGYTSTIDEIEQALNEDLRSIVTIAGHTDSTGSSKYNYRLGMRRARSVAEYLISHGIATDRIVVESYGKEKPAGSNETSEGRALNRRVEIEIISSSSQQSDLSSTYFSPISVTRRRRIGL